MGWLDRLAHGARMYYIPFLSGVGAGFETTANTDPAHANL